MVGSQCRCFAIQDDVARSVQVSASSWSDTLLVNRVARAGSVVTTSRPSSSASDSSRLPVAQEITVMASVLEGSDQAETRDVWPVGTSSMPEVVMTWCMAAMAATSFLVAAVPMSCTAISAGTPTSARCGAI